MAPEELNEIADSKYKFKHFQETATAKWLTEAIGIAGSKVQIK